jgi:TRAP-type C4-dicarboxylate transport system permease small subunit
MTPARSPWVAPLELLCATVLLLLTGLTAVDVLGRYLFAAPVPEAADYVRGLMGVLIFGGLPLVSRRNAHLRAGFFDTLFTGRALALRETGVTAASAFASAVWAWQLGRQARELHASGEILGMVPLKVGVLVWGMAGLAAVSTLLLLAHLPRAWRGQVGARAGSPPDDGGAAAAGASASAAAASGAAAAGAAVSPAAASPAAASATAASTEAPR